MEGERHFILNSVTGWFLRWEGESLKFGKYNTSEGEPAPTL